MKNFISTVLIMVGIVWALFWILALDSNDLSFSGALDTILGYLGTLLGLVLFGLGVAGLIR